MKFNFSRLTNPISVCRECGILWSMDRKGERCDNCNRELEIIPPKKWERIVSECAKTFPVGSRAKVIGKNSPLGRHYKDSIAVITGYNQHEIYFPIQVQMSDNKGNIFEDMATPFDLVPIDSKEKWMQI